MGPFHLTLPALSSPFLLFIIPIFHASMLPFKYLSSMNLHAIETGNFKLDGGAMFGVIPKSLWHKVYPADENNLCNLSMRCLVVETDGRKILIDAGLGTKQDE